MTPHRYARERVWHIVRESVGPDRHRTVCRRLVVTAKLRKRPGQLCRKCVAAVQAKLNCNLGPKIEIAGSEFQETETSRREARL